jgi:hypothetical protein
LLLYFISVDSKKSATSGGCFLFWLDTAEGDMNVALVTEVQ